MPQNNNAMFDVNVDIKMLIDGTGSMGPLIEMVKENAITFHERLYEKLQDYDRELDELRIKVCVFRDFECDGDKAFEESRFFNLPQENEEFEKYVRGIKAEGGGDPPESALDAIALAMKPDWVAEGAKKRHIIMLWTDAPTKAAGTNDEIGVPQNNGELVSWWLDPQCGKMDIHAKRLIVYAPNDESWDIINDLENTVWVKTNLGEGLKDMDMEVVLNTLSASI